MIPQPTGAVLITPERRTGGEEGCTALQYWCATGWVQALQSSCAHLWPHRPIKTMFQRLHGPRCSLPVMSPVRATLPRGAALPAAPRRPLTATLRRSNSACTALLPRVLPARPALPHLRARRRQGRGTALAARAMVNVDFSPSVLLGVSLIGAGVSLWQIRQVKPEISKDYDVVVSCVSLLVGGILIFQVRGRRGRAGQQRLGRLPGQQAWPTAPSRRCAPPAAVLFQHFTQSRTQPRPSPGLLRRAGAWTRCCCLAS